MSSYIWDGDPHYVPRNPQRDGAKNPEKTYFQTCKIIPQFYGGENLRICGDRWGQTTGPKNTKKWPQNIGTPMSFLQGAMHIKHGSHHAEPERCLYTREMRVAEVQADQKKVPQNRRKPKDISHISASLQTIGASLPEISIAWFITSQKKMSWNASTLVSALTLSAQISDPDGGRNPLLEINQIQWFWGSRVPNFDRHPFLRSDLFFSSQIVRLFSNYLIQYVVLIRIVFRAMGWYGSFLPPSTTFWNKPRMLRFSNFNQDSYSCEHVLPLHSALKHRAPYIATLAAWQNIKSRYEQKKHQHHLPSLTTNKQKMATLQGTTVARTFIFKSRKGLPSTSQGKWHSWIVYTQPLRPCDLAIN